MARDPSTGDGDAVEVDVVASDLDADAVVVAGGTPPSGRRPLSAERIVTAAVDFIDEFGLPGLSMRRLGAMLDVEAMSLYRYVKGREELLDAVVQRLVDGMEDDPDVLSSPSDGWQDFLQRLAHGIRRVALAHPKAFPLVASRPVEAPWLRPPLRSVEWVENFLQGLTDEGFSDDAAVRAYRSFSSFLLGHLLLEVAVRGADLGPLDVLPEDEHDDFDAAGATARFPLVERLSDDLAEDRSAEEFEETLEDLLNRLALLRTEY